MLRGGAIICLTRKQINIPEILSVNQKAFRAGLPQTRLYTDNKQIYSFNYKLASLGLPKGKFQYYQCGPKHPHFGRHEDFVKIFICIYILL